MLIIIFSDYCATIYSKENQTNLQVYSKEPCKSVSGFERVKVRAGCVLQGYMHKIKEIQVKRLLVAKELY